MSIASLRPCDDQESTAGCIVVTFDPTNQPKSLAITCKGYLESLEFKPRWRKFLLTPADATVICDVPSQCFLRVPGLKPSTEYHAYCAMWHSPGTVEIFPETPGLTLRTARWTPSEETFYEVQTLVWVVLIAIFIVGRIAFRWTRRKIGWGMHEVGVSVIFGIMIGWVIKFGLGKSMPFNYKFFSAVLLPLVIFAEGFTMHKSSFFNYGEWIVLFGLGGTVLVFFGIYTASILFLDSAAHDLISNQNLLILSATLASSDVVLPLTVLQKTSAIYHVTVGEGIINDIVTVLLVSTLSRTHTAHMTFELLAWTLFTFIFVSGAIGLFFGFTISYVSKHFSLGKSHTAANTVIIILGNYIAYVVAHLAEVSGVLALFVSSILCSHYAYHSLNRDSQVLLQGTSNLFSFFSQAFVFGYLGATSWQYIERSGDKHETSPSKLNVITFYFFTLIATRFLVVAGLSLPMRRFLSPSLSIKELFSFAVAGMTRGTVSYALICLAAPPHEMQTHGEEMMVSTVLGIVILSALFGSTLFPLFFRETKRSSVTASDTAHEEEHGGPAFLAWQHFDDKFMKPLLRRAPARAPALLDAEM